MNDIVQSTYREELREGIEGQQINAIPATFISATVQNAEGLGFGKAAGRGTADRTCIPFAGTAVLGIAVRDRSLDANNPDSFGQYDSARLMTKGAILVTVAVAVSAGDSVWVRPSNNTFQNDNTNSAIQIANAVYDSSAAIGELAVVRLG